MRGGLRCWWIRCCLPSGSVFCRGSSERVEAATGLCSLSTWCLMCADWAGCSHSWFSCAFAFLGGGAKHLSLSRCKTLPYAYRRVNGQSTYFATTGIHFQHNVDHLVLGGKLSKGGLTSVRKAQCKPRPCKSHPRE